MALGHLTITLNPGVDPEEFEKFAANELFPAARTVIPSRIGRVRVRHTLLRESTSDDEREPRTYLWRVEQNGFDSANTRAEGYGFATDIGAGLKARLESFGRLDFGIAEERFGRVIAQSDEELSTPVEGSSESDPQGWVTPRPEKNQF